MAKDSKAKHHEAHLVIEQLLRNATEESPISYHGLYSHPDFIATGSPKHVVADVLKKFKPQLSSVPRPGKERSAYYFSSVSIKGGDMQNTARTATRQIVPNRGRHEKNEARLAAEALFDIPPSTKEGDQLKVSDVFVEAKAPGVAVPVTVKPHRRTLSLTPPSEVNPVESGESSMVSTEASEAVGKNNESASNVNTETAENTPTAPAEAASSDLEVSPLKAVSGIRTVRIDLGQIKISIEFDSMTSDPRLGLSMN
jgi:hypothetical protein